MGILYAFLANYLRQVAVGAQDMTDTVSSLRGQTAPPPTREEYMRKYQLRWRKRKYRTNPDYRAKCLADSKALNARKKTDPYARALKKLTDSMYHRRNRIEWLQAELVRMERELVAFGKEKFQLEQRRKRR